MSLARSGAARVVASYHWRDDPFLAWRAATYSTLFVLAALAWWVTDSRVSDMGMSMGPGTIAFFMVTWVVMMAAMMFPSVAPMVATYVSIQRGRVDKKLPAPSRRLGVLRRHRDLFGSMSPRSSVAVLMLLSA